MAFEWVEFFAGHAEATKNMKEHGYSSARLDVTYMSSLGGKPNSNPMDILSDAGMAMLGLNMVGTKHTKFFVCKNLHSCHCMMFQFRLWYTSTSYGLYFLFVQDLAEDSNSHCIVGKLGKGMDLPLWSKMQFMDEDHCRHFGSQCLQCNW